MNPKIISIILGIVLLSSVASFSPTPVNAAFTLDAPFLCSWTFPGTVDDPTRSQDPVADRYEDKTNYTHVMPGISAWGGVYGVPPLIGPVTFSYQEEGREKVFIAEEVANDYTDVGQFGEGTGETTPFDYGIVVRNDVNKEWVSITLICLNDKQTVTSSQLVITKWLKNPSAELGGVGATDDSDGDGVVDSLDQCDDEQENFNGYLDSDGCIDVLPDEIESGEIIDVPEKIIDVPKEIIDVPAVKKGVPDWIKNNAKWWSEGTIGDSDFTSGIQFMIKENIISVPGIKISESEKEIQATQLDTKYLKLNADEFIRPTTRGMTTEVMISGYVEDFSRGTSVYLNIEFPNGEIQSHKLIAAGGDYNTRLYLQHDSQVGEYKITTQYNGVDVDAISVIVKLKSSVKTSPEIPPWIKNNAGWWADGLIGEDDFVNGIKYLVEKGIIKV